MSKMLGGPLRPEKAVKGAVKKVKETLGCIKKAVIKEPKTRLKLWSPNCKNDDYKYLRLVKWDADTVELRVVNAKGERVSGGSLIGININRGTISRYTDVSPECGLSLDPMGRVISN